MWGRTAATEKWRIGVQIITISGRIERPGTKVPIRL